MSASENARIYHGNVTTFTNKTGGRWLADWQTDHHVSFEIDGRQLCLEFLTHWPVYTGVQGSLLLSFFFKYGVHLVGSWFSFCGECSQDLFLHWWVLSPPPATQWLVLRSRSAREKFLEILRRGWELNPGHKEDRQWAIPLSYHDWLSLLI